VAENRDREKSTFMTHVSNYFYQSFLCMRTITIDIIWEADIEFAVIEPVNVFFIVGIVLKN